MSKSDSGKVSDPATWTWPSTSWAWAGISTALVTPWRVRSPTRVRSVAVPARAAAGMSTGWVMVNVAVGNASVSRPSLRIRLSRRPSSEAIVVVSTSIVPPVSWTASPLPVEGDRAGHVAGAADRVGLGGQVGELLADPIAGLGLPLMTHVAGQLAVRAGVGAGDGLGRGAGIGARRTARSSGRSEAAASGLDDGRARARGRIATQERVVGEVAADRRPRSRRRRTRASEGGAGHRGWASGVGGLVGPVGRTLAGFPESRLRRR